jgi:colanic acid biosynthesis glycosyl transferase WcaI
VKILFVNQHYPPDGGATGKLVAQLSERLAASGHEVTVLTGRPTYDEMKGRRAPNRQSRAGVDVIRLPILPRWNGGLGRALHYASFALSVLLRGLRMSRPDVVLAFSSTPLFGGLAVSQLARRKACPLVYVVQDVYPEIAVALGALRPGRWERAARALDRRVWECAQRVVLIGDGLLDVAVERGVALEKVRVIPNWADPEHIVPLTKSAFRRQVGIGEHEFVVQYAGNVGRSQDLSLILDAAEIVTARNPNVCFLIVGSGSAEAELRRRTAELPQIKVIPFQPERMLSEVLAVADVSVVPLRTGLTRYCVPSKFYSIAASGRAVAAAVDANSDIARLVEELDCGFRVDPGDAAGLARGILELAGRPERARAQGANGRAFAESLGSLDRAVSDYETLLKEVVFPSSGSTDLPTGTEETPASSSPSELEVVEPPGESDAEWVGALEASGAR